MLFGVVFIRKNAKTWHSWKSFTLYLHNRSTLEHNSNRFWKLQCSATTFLYILVLEIGHVTTLLTTHCMDPDRYNHPYLVFLHLSVKLSDIFFLGYMHRTLTWTLKAVPHYTSIICTIPIFSDFFWYSFIRNIQISFFGHVPWTLKTSPNNTDHLSYFLIYFIAIFHQEMQMFPYLEMHTGPWTPNIITNNPLFFSPFFPLF